MLLTEFILDLLFPSFCLGCGRFNTLLCADCYQQLNFLALPVSPQLEKSYLTQILAMAHYEGLMKKMIHQLKFKSVKPVGRLLGELVVMTMNLPPVDYLTAIPLSDQRRRQRGFNQAAVIARNIASLKKINYQPFLKRSRNTAPQASINDRQQRLVHLKNCFTPLNQVKVKADAKILLVDDVVTTGTTLNEAAKVLQKMGFKKIYGLAMAHGG